MAPFFDAIFEDTKKVHKKCQILPTVRISVPEDHFIIVMSGFLYSIQSWSNNETTFK